ncbi:MAG: hypothetical protein PUD39_03960 [Bacteroidales bacterium]|nr:hypothetical protein [Bacteroidales bacterium]
MKNYLSRNIVIVMIAIAAVVIALVVNKPDAYPEEPELELCPIDTIV